MALSFDHASLAEVALEKGFLDRHQVRECLKLEAQAAEAGKAENFVDILLDKGWLTPEQLTACKRALAGQDKVGGFELLEMVGQGSMGAVFRGRQTALDRIVAIKVLPKKFSQDKTYVKKFLAEARTVAKLNHQNIIQGIDVGVDGEYMFFAMEYVDGPTVRQVIRDRGKISEDKALSITLHVAHALNHAEKNSLVHRDVKPDNIMMTSDGIAKLCDLGLARQTEALEGGSAAGTPFYISPEQAQGSADLDIRTDIYSLGATLFHMLTGRPPYLGETPQAVMEAHIRSAVPDPKKLEPGISPKVADLVKRMMAKSPDKRPATAADLIKEIQALRAPAEEPEAQKPQRSSRTSLRTPVRGRSGGAGGIVVAVAAVAGLLAVVYMMSSPDSGNPADKHKSGDDFAISARDQQAADMLREALKLIDGHADDHAANVKILERVIAETAGTPSQRSARNRLGREKRGLVKAERVLFETTDASARQLAREGKFKDAMAALMALPEKIRTGRREETIQETFAHIESRAARAVEEAKAIAKLEEMKVQATTKSAGLIAAKIAVFKQYTEVARKAKEAADRELADERARARLKAAIKLIRTVHEMTSSGRIDEAERFIESAPAMAEFKDITDAIAAEKRDMTALKNFNLQVVKALAAQRGTIKLNWKGRSLAGTVKGIQGDRALVRTRMGAEFAVAPWELAIKDVLALAGRSPAGDRTGRAAAFCAMGLMDEAKGTLAGQTGAEADRLKGKIAVLTMGKEAGAKALLDEAARQLADGKPKDALQSLARLADEFADTELVASEKPRIDKLAADAQAGLKPAARSVDIETGAGEAGKMAASGQWRAITAATVRPEGRGVMRLTWSLADPVQGADWRKVSGGWSLGAGALNSTTDDDAVIISRIPFQRIDSIAFECVSNGRKPAGLGWTAYNAAESYPGGAFWGWMRQQGIDFHGGTSLESAGKVITSKMKPAQHGRLHKMSVQFGNGSARWKLGGSILLESDVDAFPGGRFFGLGSAGGPVRFTGISVLGVPDYKAIALMIEGALERGRIAAKASRGPWRQLFDKNSLTGWQTRTGLWNANRGTIEKAGPPPRGRGGRRNWTGGPSLVSSDVKASDFIFEASAYVASGGTSTDHEVGLAFGDLGGAHWRALADIGKNRWRIEPNGGAGAADFLPLNQKLEAGEERVFRVTAIGDHVRVDVDGRTRIVARVPGRSGNEVGLYCRSSNAVRFKNVRLIVIK